jgi:acetate---CoA ligase (ADP-forming)
MAENFKPGAASSNVFKALFSPNRTAIFGSVKNGKIAHQIITQLFEGGYKGKLHAVNPKAEVPEGFPKVAAFSDADKIGERPDLAIVCTPSAFTLEVLEKCGKLGVPAVVVITSGFGEAGNKEGEDALAACARKYGMRLIGPNCAGIMSTPWSFYPSIEVRALPGRTAFITQSGAVGGAVLAMAKPRGIGFSRFVSFGNRCDIGENELLEYLIEDDETDAIALYLESLQDGRAFIKIARAAASKKPLMIIKAGRSSSGLRAASSHTGSLAGSDSVFNTMIRQTGAIRVDGIEEMLDLCYGFTLLPPMKGRKTAIITNSGGPGILTSDSAEACNLDVAATPQKTVSELRKFLPAYCGFSNPIDLTVGGNGENYRRALEVMLGAGYDGAIAINVGTPFLDSTGIARGIVEAGRNSGKPIAAAFMAGEIVEDGARILDKERSAHFPTGERAARVLAMIADYYSKQASPHPAPDTAIHLFPAKKLPISKPIFEPDAVSFLENEGFPFPANTFITSIEGCAPAIEKTGFPCVLKVVSPEILHKSDQGGVVLNIDSREALESSFSGMQKKFSGQDFRGAMIYRQIAPSLELIAGVNTDPDFGPVLLAGAGGVYTELLSDVSLRIVPLNQAAAMEMLSELKITALMRGYRGKPPLDIQAAADLLAKLSKLALTYPEIKELDFNPIFLFEKGCMIGDTRILV